jgi:hypothetical protein
VEHATHYPRRKRFVPIHRPRKLFKLQQLRGIKVDLYFLKKPHSETTKCPSLAKKILQMAEETL